MSLNSLKSIFYELPKLKDLQRKCRGLHLVAAFNEVKDYYFDRQIAQDIQAMEARHQSLIVACLSYQAAEKVRSAERPLLDILSQASGSTTIKKITCIY